MIAPAIAPATNPLTNLPLKNSELFPNRVLKSMIGNFKEKERNEETPENPYVDFVETKQ